MVVTGGVFVDRKFSSDCFTHEFGQLIRLAGLDAELAQRLAGSKAAGDAFDLNWGIATQWDETSRYETKTQVEATELLNAITNNPDGVLPWIQRLLVDERFGDAEKLIKQLDQDGFGVSVAVWVRPRESRMWTLYIGTNSVGNGRSQGGSYGRLYESLSKIPRAIAFGRRRETHRHDQSNRASRDSNSRPVAGKNGGTFACAMAWWACGRRDLRLSPGWTDEPQRNCAGRGRHYGPPRPRPALARDAARRLNDRRRSVPHHKLGQEIQVELQDALAQTTRSRSIRLRASNNAMRGR